MESNGISHNEINHFARIGAKDLVGMLAAMQRFKSSGYASVSEWVAATGNMSGSMPSVYYSGGQSYYTGDTSSSTISMGNYTKAGSAFFATGMTFTTFNNLRNDRANFSGTNILHAGEDIGKHELDVNDPRIARNFAIMDKYDNARRPERNRLFKDLAKRTQDDEEMSRLKKAYDAAGTDAEKSAIAAQIQEHGRIIQQQNGTAAHIKTAPQESREATQQSADDIVAKSLGIQAQHRAQMGLAPVASVNNRSLAAVNKSFAENGIVTQRSISADNVITTGVATKDADFSAQLLALGTQPQIKTGEADQLGNSDKKVASAEPPQAIPAIKAETSAARPVVHDKKSEAATLSAIPAVSTEKKPPAQVVKNTTASPSVGV